MTEPAGEGLRTVQLTDEEKKAAVGVWPCQQCGRYEQDECNGFSFCPHGRKRPNMLAERWPSLAAACQASAEARRAAQATARALAPALPASEPDKRRMADAMRDGALKTLDEAIARCAEKVKKGTLDIEAKDGKVVWTGQRVTAAGEMAAKTMRDFQEARADIATMAL